MGYGDLQAMDQKEDAVGLDASPGSVFGDHTFPSVS
jgi:hypothetical protein